MLKITLGVDGMMCGMCESHVNDAVRKAFPVKKVTSSHGRRQRILTEQDLDEQAVRDAVNATGYTVTSFSKEPYEKRDCSPFCINEQSKAALQRLYFQHRLAKSNLINRYIPTEEITVLETLLKPNTGAALSGCVRWTQPMDGRARVRF